MPTNTDGFSTFRFEIASAKLTELIDELNLFDILGADYRGLSTLRFAPPRNSYYGVLRGPLQCAELSLFEQSSISLWLAYVLRTAFERANPHARPAIARAASVLSSRYAEYDASIDSAIFLDATFAFDGTSALFMETRSGTQITTYECSCAAYLAAAHKTEEADFHAFLYQPLFILRNDIPKLKEIRRTTYSATALADPSGPPLTVKP